MSRPIDDLADDYVLGLLDPAEAAEVERLIATDEGAARAVGRARDQFLALDLTAAPAELPADFSERVTRAVAASDDGADDVAPAVPAAANQNVPLGRRRWWTAAAAAVVALGVGIGLGTMVSVTEPVVVAVLLDADGTPTAVVEDFGNDTATVRFLADLVVPSGQVMQVWTLPSKERGPVSLGLVEHARPATLRWSDLPEPAGNQLYEITLERAGGSPTGRPTGPILAKGFAATQG